MLTPGQKKTKTSEEARNRGPTSRTSSPVCWALLSWPAGKSKKPYLFEPQPDRWSNGPTWPTARKKNKKLQKSGPSVCTHGFNCSFFYLPAAKQQVVPKNLNDVTAAKCVTQSQDKKSSHCSLTKPEWCHWCRKNMWSKRTKNNMVFKNWFLNRTCSGGVEGWQCEELHLPVRIVSSTILGGCSKAGRSF